MLGRHIIITPTPPPGETALKAYTGLSASRGFSMGIGFHPTVFIPEGDSLPKIKMNTARDWFERASVAQQCNNVIGEFIPGTLCYICGLPIIEQPECEHILSVFKAAMFLHLYRNDFKIDENGYILDSNGNPLSEEITFRLMFELYLEYRWAHRCCNQIKSDYDFIKFTGRAFEFDEQNANRILSGIVETLLKSGGDICNDNKLKTELLTQIGIDKKKGKKKTDSSDDDAKIDNWIKTRKTILQKDPFVGSKQTDYIDNNQGAVGAILHYLNTGVTIKKEWFNNPTQPTSIKSYINFFFSKKDITTYTLIRSLSDPVKENGFLIMQILARTIMATDVNNIHRVYAELNGCEYTQYIKPFAVVPTKEITTIAMTISDVAKTLEGLLRRQWGRDVTSAEIVEFYQKLLILPNSSGIVTGRGISISSQRFPITDSIKELSTLTVDAFHYTDVFRIVFSYLKYGLRNDDDYLSAEIASLSLKLLLTYHYHFFANNNIVLNPKIKEVFIKKFYEEIQQLISRITLISSENKAFSVIYTFSTYFGEEFSSDIIKIFEANSVSDLTPISRRQLAFYQIQYFLDNVDAEKIMDYDITDITDITDIDDSKKTTELKNMSYASLLLLKFKNLTPPQVSYGYDIAEYIISNLDSSDALLRLKAELIKNNIIENLLLSTNEQLKYLAIMELIPIESEIYKNLLNELHNTDKTRYDAVAENYSKIISMKGGEKKYLYANKRTKLNKPKLNLNKKRKTHKLDRRK